MSELVTTSQTPSIGDISDLVLAIQNISTLEEATAATHVVQGISAYAKAQKSLELVNQATELRIWAERKGGEAIVTNGDKLASLYQTHGISYATARRWVDIYLLSESFIRNFVSEAVVHGQEINMRTMLSRGRDESRVKVSTGVFKEISGVYTIEWKQGGYPRKKGGFRNKDKAIAERKQKVRIASTTTVYDRKMSRRADISVAYGYIRKALDTASRLDKRPGVDEAIEHLYKAEDALSRVMKIPTSSTVAF